MRDRADMWDHTCLDEYETQTELKDYNDTFSEFGDRDEVSQQIRGPAMHFTLYYYSWDYTYIIARFLF